MYPVPGVLYWTSSALIAVRCLVRCDTLSLAVLQAVKKIALKRH